MKVEVLLMIGVKLMFLKIIFTQVHDLDSDDHMTVSVAEYKQVYKRKETRYCTEHQSDSYNSTCDRCHQVFCPQFHQLPGSCHHGKQMSTSNSIYY